jgi:hypothetical protein
MPTADRPLSAAASVSDVVERLDLVGKQVRQIALDVTRLAPRIYAPPPAPVATGPVLDKLLMMIQGYRSAPGDEDPEFIAGKVEGLAIAVIELGGKLSKEPRPRTSPATSNGSHAVTSGLPKTTQVRVAPRPFGVRTVGGAPLGSDAPSGGRKKVLVTLAESQAGLTRAQLRVITGLRRRTVDDYLFWLRARGYVVQNGDRFVAMGNGWLSAGQVVVPRGDALRRMWMDKLTGGPARMLELVCAAYPLAMARTDLADTGWAVRTRNDYLYKLHALELITEVGRNGVRASDTLFDQGPGLT